MTVHPSADAPILVVDDDAASAKLVVAILHTEGCAARAVGSAEEAFALLANIRPRLIVLDLILPLMSGLLFAQQLKASPATSEIPLIAVTVYNGPEAEQMVRAAGFAAYVRKPIDPSSFAELVLKHLKEAS